MRFALHLSDVKAEAGGAFTFENEILQEWLKPQTRHEPCFCSFERESPLPGSRLEHVSLRLPFQRRLSHRLLERTFGWLVKAGLVPGTSEPPGSIYPLRTSDRLRNKGIRLVWYLSPVVTPIPNMPYVMTVWDLQHRLQPFFPEVSDGPEWNRRESRLRGSLQQASFVITGTSRGMTEIERFYGIDRSRIRVLPMPAPAFALNAGSTTPDRSLLDPLGVRQPYLFYPAQFWSHKNHVVLLHMLSLLREQHGEPINLVLSGSDHGNRAHLEALAAKLGVHDLVRITGFITVPQLVALYQHATAVVYPSYFGPDNLPPLEAFAIGCPVIAADVPGSEEQLGDAAIRVPPSNEESFAQAVLQVRRNSRLRQDLIDKGRQRASQLTAAQYVKGMADVLDEFALIARCWP